MANAHCVGEEVAAGILPPVEPWLPARRNRRRNFHALNRSEAFPGGRMPALYGRQDARRYSYAAISGAGPREASNHGNDTEKSVGGMRSADTICVPCGPLCCLLTAVSAERGSANTNRVRPARMQSLCRSFSAETRCPSTQVPLREFKSLMT